ncbi:MAG: hypothetical protein HQK60_13140 [Deltaproteobacteria bacterium]|nr:hypothetical protein [Deltaproteobacteria bacterium]
MKKELFLNKNKSVGSVLSIWLVAIVLLVSVQAEAADYVTVSRNLDSINFIATSAETENYETIFESDSTLSALPEDSVVYFLIKEEKFKKGDVFQIFATEYPVHHPVTDALIGYFNEITGEFKITKVLEDKGLYQGQITKAFTEIKIGQKIRPKVAMDKKIKITTTDLIKEGIIVQTEGDYQMVAGNDLVFIDLGLMDGVKVGQMFKVYKVNKTKGDTTLPDIYAGKIMVLKPKLKTSSAIILSSDSEIKNKELYKIISVQDQELRKGTALVPVDSSVGQ